METPIHTWLFDDSVIPKLQNVTTFESLHNVAALIRVFNRAFVLATNSVSTFGFNKARQLSDIVNSVFGDYNVEDFFCGCAFPFDDACYELKQALLSVEGLDPFFVGKALDKLSRLFDAMSDDLDRKYSDDE